MLFSTFEVFCFVYISYGGYVPIHSNCLVINIYVTLQGYQTVVLSSLPLLSTSIFRHQQATFIILFF